MYSGFYIGCEKYETTNFPVITTYKYRGDTLPNIYANHFIIFNRTNTIQRLKDINWNEIRQTQF